MDAEYQGIIWVIVVIWVGWPLHLIAKHLGFIVVQIKERK